MKEKEAQSNHEVKLASSERLMTELDIRRGLRGKLFYLYPETFRALHSILDESEGFDGLIWMHSSQSMVSKSTSGVVAGGTITLHLNEELAFNSQLLLHDIFDDYWASCLCFQSGFTKQAQAILRSTLELLVQLYYLKHLAELEPLTSDSWALGARGIEGFTDKVRMLKKKAVSKKLNFGSRLEFLYDRLCTSTHSRKDRLTAMNLPRMERAKDMPSFEPLEILYTKGAFCSVLDLGLRMIQVHLAEEPETTYVGNLRAIIESMLNRLDKMKACIQTFEKGYIIHREHIALSSGKQILYSVTLNKKYEFPGRKKPRLNEAERKEFRRKFESTLFADIS
jgi:hypothetical protein